MKRVQTEKVRPIHEMVLLQPEANPEATSGGIIIPKTVRDKTQLGTVLRVGPGRVTETGRRVEPEIKAGDRVIYLENNIGQRINAAAQEGDPILLPEIEIIAVIEL